jgi:hypothetical protein
MPLYLRRSLLRSDFAFLSLWLCHEVGGEAAIPFRMLNGKAEHFRK